MSDEPCEVCGRPKFPPRSGRGPQQWECFETGDVECGLAGRLVVAETDLAAARRSLEEARELIRLCTKYVVEDRAVTPGLTRLSRWVDRARAFLRPVQPTPVTPTCETCKGTSSKYVGEGMTASFVPCPTCTPGAKP